MKLMILIAAIIGGFAFATPENKVEEKNNSTVVQSEFSKLLGKKIFVNRLRWNFLGNNFLDELNPYMYELDPNPYPTCGFSGNILCSMRAYMDAWAEIPDLSTVVDRHYKW